MDVTGPLGSTLMLCSVSVVNLPLTQVIPAAAAAGFDCMSLYTPVYRRAVEREGLTTATIRAMLDDHGIVINEIEVVGDWMGPLDHEQYPWLDLTYSSEELLDLANELGADTVAATYFGPAADPSDYAAGFAALCDAAAGRGLRIALEYPAMATISSFPQAARVIREADRANGGLMLDTWHHRRSGSVGVDVSLLPADRVFSVQVADADEPVGPPAEDIVNRLLPGAGGFDVAGMLRELDDLGVRCPVGVEVLRREIVQQGAVAATRILHDALAAVVR
jgi:sugar phosphate isomerase/epimerase